MKLPLVSHCLGAVGEQSAFISPAVVGLHLSVQVHGQRQKEPSLRKPLDCLGRLSPVGLGLSAATPAARHHPASL